MVSNNAPDGIPVLSRGKHRNPRRGACFMEMASVLAGEPWSDSPRCTHPLLAQLARMVNDFTTDARRARLLPHIPSIIGVHGGGLAWEVSMTAAVAVEAIPQVPARFQRVLAVGLLHCNDLAVSLGPSTVGGLSDVGQALAEVPDAAAWARRFVDGVPLSARQFQRRSAPHLMTYAVKGIVEAELPDTDDRLYDLLTHAIGTARRLETPAPSTNPLRL